MRSTGNVAQAFQPAGSRDFPVPCSGICNWGLESPQNPQTGMSALRRLKAELRTVIVFVLATVFAASMSFAATNEARIFQKSPGTSEFAFGADLSFLKQAEDGGKVFKDGTNATPGLQLFREHGYNWIRLRIFVEPVLQRYNHLPLCGHLTLSLRA